MSRSIDSPDSPDSPKTGIFTLPGLKWSWEKTWHFPLGPLYHRFDIKLGSQQEIFLSLLYLIINCCTPQTETPVSNMGSQTWSTLWRRMIWITSIANKAESRRSAGQAFRLKCPLCRWWRRGRAGAGWARNVDSPWVNFISHHYGSVSGSPLVVRRSLIVVSGLWVKGRQGLFRPS